ncbi:YiaA/YiaB family inner membrane protein [Streptacidiphilus rugosus]|uniref:YiaA/YiaB family inner membrane protein n=1 Tax=Streptacidiphilus rugosus TaxID=405783 RepID=UPI00056C1977|nr:YiaA/YiaB family inner membrane protein [Streptacidiphilus rugosus]
MANTPPVRQGTTGAYYAQAVISFALSVLAMAVGIAYLHTDGWIRAFLGLGLLYVVTSAFTLAKVIRDRQDETRYSSRVDQARLDKLLAEHDPFRVDA